MQLPAFIQGLPEHDLPFPAEAVTSHAVRSEDALVVFFEFRETCEIPPHAHGAQWGTVLAGHLDLTISDEKRRYGPGDSYSIPAGAVHSVLASAGAKVIDVFAEPDRYALKT